MFISRPLFSLIASVVLLGVQSLFAQEFDPPEAPLADDATPVAASVTFSDASSVNITSKRGQFPLVAIGPKETISVSLQFVLAVDNSLILQALDGGKTSQPNVSVGTDGKASIAFESGIKPGIYRVSLNQGGTSTTLQFWVADPQNPELAPPSL